MYKPGRKERSPLASRETSPSRRPTSRETSPVRRGTSPVRRETSPTRNGRATSPSRRPTSRGTSPARNQSWTPNWDGFPKPSARAMSKHDIEDEDDLSWIEERQGWSGKHHGRHWTTHSHGEKHSLTASPRAEKRRVVWKPSHTTPSTHCRTDTYEWSPCGERSRSLHHHHEKVEHDHVDAVTYRNGPYFDKTVHHHHEMMEAKHNAKGEHHDREVEKAIAKYNKLARERGYRTINSNSLKKLGY